MNKNEIKQFLDAFYNGTSTDEEDQQLIQLFLSEEEIPEEFEADRKCFQALYQTDYVGLPEKLQERLETRLYAYMRRKKKRDAARKYLYRIGSAAAIALVCIGLYVYEAKPEPPLADTYTDPVEAVFAAYKALAFMSTQINVGLQQVSEATQELQKANEIVYQQLKD